MPGEVSMSRNLREVVQALGISQGELQYQANRLRTLATPKSEMEREHLTKLADDYETAARTIGKLWGYQKGRLEQQEARSSEAMAQADGMIGFYPDDDDEE